jgi:hypothetical protein
MIRLFHEALVLPFCRSAVLPFCRSAVLPFCRSAVLPFCRLLERAPRDFWRAKHPTMAVVPAARRG